MLRRCSRVETATKGSRFIEHHSKSKKARCPAQPWRAEANARTSTYTYADIRRHTQADANATRPDRLKPQRTRQSIALNERAAPAPSARARARSAPQTDLQQCGPVPVRDGFKASQLRHKLTPPVGFFHATLMRLINWGCGLPSPRQADLIGPGAASVSGPVQFINSLFSTRHFAGIRAVLTGPVLAAPSAPARQRTPDTSPDHLTCTPPTHP